LKTDKKPVLYLLFVVALIFSISMAQSNSKIDISSLEGNWEGNGKFLVPMTGVRINIAGRAEFRYDREAGYLRTAITGNKFLFSYSDSGHLFHDPLTDSISWEIWDNSGKHALYQGVAEGNLIKGARLRKGKIYSVMIQNVTNDSIDFKLTTTDPNGESVDRATFNLWRVKD